MEPTIFTGAQRNLSALVDFSNLINSRLDLDFTLNNLLLTCFGKFHTTKGLVALTDRNGIIEVRAVKGFVNKDCIKCPKILAKDYDSGSPEIKNFMAECGFAYCKEIVSSQGLRGAIFLGKKMTGTEYGSEDKEFLNTIVNIAATAIENAIVVEEIKRANRDLDSKVSQLSALFELSKEFGGILNANRVGKLLIYSIIGQLLVSTYAVVSFDGETKIIETKMPEEALLAALKKYDISLAALPLEKEKITEAFPDFSELGIELIVPMQIQNKTKGAIILGKRINAEEYSETDIEYVYSVGSLAIISLENEKLFKEALEKQKMEEDLQIAREIQQNLFPASTPKLKNFEIAVLNIPSRQVGGDYYDLIKLENTDNLFAIADVSGKGVPASLLMANLQAFIKTLSKRGIPNLSESTELINDLVSENTIMGNFITFFWGLLKDEEREITYVNAGHNPPLLIRGGKVNYLKKGGMILGLMKTMIPYESESLTLEPGDALILFTDGITEAMNKNKEEFSDERLEKLAVNSADKSAKDILEMIRREVVKHVNGAEQSDDITLMVIKSL